MSNRFYFIVITFSVLLLGYLSYQVLKPFFSPIAWSIVFSVLFYPMYLFILRHVRSATVAAIIVLLVITAVIVGPVFYISFLLVAEVRYIIQYVERIDIEAIKGLTQHPTVDGVTKRLTELMGITVEELNKSIIDGIRQSGRDVVGWFTKRLGDMIISLLNFILMLLTTFFLLSEGPGFFKKIRDYLPFREEQKDRLAMLVQDIVISTMYGGVIVAIVQGTLGGLVFALVGLPAPVTWGVAMAIFSFLPLIGPFVVWLPAAIYLFIIGEVFRGIALVLIGTFVIGLVDNFLRPYIIGSRIKMSFILLFFSVLGGIKVFGVLGLILGPLVLALFVSVIEVFRSMEESANSFKH